MQVCAQVDSDLAHGICLLTGQGYCSPSRCGQCCPGNRRRITSSCDLHPVLPQRPGGCSLVELNTSLWIHNQVILYS